jgi:hypothetical protein
MSEPSDSRVRDRREFLKMTGSAVGGAVLLSFGCSETSVGVTDLALPSDYNFYKVFDASQNLFEPLRQLTPGIMINDQGKIVFYGDNGGDNYGIYELTMDFSDLAPKIAGSRTIVRTGVEIPGGQVVRRIHRADLNDSGDVALLLDFYADGSGPATAEALGTVFVNADNEMNRIVGFGESMPDGSIYGGAFGDVAIDNQRNLLLVSHYVRENDDFGNGVFCLPAFQVSGTQPLLLSGTALQGQGNSIVRGFGLIDVNERGNYVAQTQITLPVASGSPAASSGSAGSLLQGTAGLRQLSTHPRLLSAPEQFRLETQSPGEVILGPRAGAGGAAAWVAHGPDGDKQAIFFRDESRPVTEVARATSDGPIYSFSAPVLSNNGALFYLQFNPGVDGPIELKTVSSDAPTTILKLGDQIGGQETTGLMFGYHSRQADKAGRIVVYAEFGEGNPAIVVGIPA